MWIIFFSTSTGNLAVRDVTIKRAYSILQHYMLMHENHHLTLENSLPVILVLNGILYRAVIYWVVLVKTWSATVPSMTLIKTLINV